MLSIESLIAIAIFSFVPLAIKFTSANPYTIGIFRLAISSFFVLIFWKNKISLGMFKKKESYRLVLLGLFFFCHWITYFYAIKIGGSQACVLGMSTYGIQLIINGSVFLNYHLRPRNYISLFIVLLGLILVLPSFEFKNEFTQGLGLGLLSASFYSFLPILHQRTNQYFGHEVRIFSQFFFALIFFLFFLPETNWTLSTSDWNALLFLAILGTLVAHSLWAHVTSKIPTYISGIIYYAITPCALFLSYLAFGELLSTKQIFGAILIIFAAILNIWSTRDQNTKT